VSERGEIYVLANQAMPGLVKVGKTRGDAAQRAAQLSGPTGIPEHFEVVRAYKVLDADAAERLAHTVLERTNGRPNNRREFFFGPAAKVVEVLNQALLRYTQEDDDLPEGWDRALVSVQDHLESLESFMIP
jgi:T5orf172 domain